MKCLRCNTEMKQYELSPCITAYSSEYKPNLLSNVTQDPHNIHSVYICDQCGYSELNTRRCKDSNK